MSFFLFNHMRFLSGLRCLALSTALVFGGCASNYRNFREYPSVNLNADFEAVEYNIDLDRKLQTTKTHPDDSKNLSETAAVLGSYPANSFRIGLTSTYGDDNFRLGIGGSIDYIFGRDGKKIEIMERSRQDTDPGTESYAFTRLSHDFVFTPYIRTEGRIRKGIIGLEVGRPYTEFSLATGLDRRHRFETKKTYSWSGFGKSIRLTFDFYLSENVDISFSAGINNYRTRFGGEKGEIESTLASVGLGWKF